MLKLGLCDYNDACILFKGTLTVTTDGADVVAREANEINKDIIFKNCAPLRDYKSQTNNTHIVNAVDIDVVVPMYNLIKHDDTYSETSRSLWQYHGD